MRGLDPRIHPRIELRFRAMDCRHRRAEATPSFGRLCPAMTLMLRIAIHIQLSNSKLPVRPHSRGAMRPSFASIATL
jgi:hypothetical protein